MSTKDITVDVPTLLTQPGASHTVLLTTFRSNGQGVSTPVGSCGRRWQTVPYDSCTHLEGQTSCEESECGPCTLYLPGQSAKPNC